MTPPVIEAIDLSKTYDSFKALSSLNLKIEGSKCVGFLGPNGSGKTTTLKIFTALISATTGKAMINGVDVSRNKKQALASCGALIETPEIYPSFTPREALMMIAEIRGIPKEDRNKRIEEAVFQVRMEDWMNKRVGKFSKGMKQRINIAAALLSDPSIVLLDEPSTGLDPKGMNEVREIVRSLKDKNKLIFMSSHLLGEVTDICEEVALIDHGKLLVYDKLENVTSKFSNLGHFIDIGLSRNVDDDVNTRISTLDGVDCVEKSGPRSLKLKLKGGVDAQEKVLYELVSMKCGVISFKESSFALEDAYLSLVKDAL